MSWVLLLFNPLQAAEVRGIFLNNINGIVKDGFLLRAWGTERDITELRRMNKELERNRKDLQKLAGRLISF